MKSKKILWIALSLLMIVALYLASNRLVHPEAKIDATRAAYTNKGGLIQIPAHSSLRQRIVVQEVQQKQSPHNLQIPGQVDADPSRTINILSPLTGRVESLNIKLGDTVHKGQLLAVIASGDMAQAFSDLDKAKDAVELARKTLERTKGVQLTGAAAIKDIESAESAVNQAEFEYQRAQNRLVSLGSSPMDKSKMQKLKIFAPISAVVTALNIGKGATVDDPTASLMTVTDLSRVWVTANVSEDLISQIRNGDEVNIVLSAYPLDTLHGKLTSVANVISPDTRRLPIHIEIANPQGHLLPNMFAQITFNIPTVSQISIPQSALLMNNDSTTVMVQVAPWTFERRTIILGYDENNEVRVLSGLKLGDKIITQGGVLIND